MQSKSIDALGDATEYLYDENSDALNKGNLVHYDQLNGGTGKWLPTELQKMYKDSEFNFTRRGQSGADVEFVSGKHPSQYKLNPMEWPEGFKYGDFNHIPLVDIKHF